MYPRGVTSCSINYMMCVSGGTEVHESALKKKKKRKKGERERERQRPTDA